MRIFSFLYLFIFYSSAFSQDSLTVEQAIKYAVDHNYGVIISKNEVEIGKINNNWANAGAYPTVSATATKTIGRNNLLQKLNTGVVITKKGSRTQNLNAGVNVNWSVFDGFKMFATKRRLEELERNGEYTFRKNVNETVYNVVTAYYNIVNLKQQLKAIREQITLYKERYKLADMRFNIGSGAKYEVLQAEVDLNEQKSNLLNIQNQVDIAKNNLTNLMGKKADTTYTVADTILINPLPDMATVQNKIDKQNPDLLLANSNLAILFHTKKEVNSTRYPVITLNGNYNFVKNANTAGFNLFTQNYGPNGSIGIAVPLFSGSVVKKQLQIADINILNQNITVDQVKNNLNTLLVNAFTNYQNALKIIDLEKNNLKVAAENISIAVQRFRLLNITSVELRQIQTSYLDAENRLYNALYQGKIAEAEIGLLTGEISTF
ncbi:MAG: TolC family protein [Ginsengibacter sp.]